ncbi:unnamed protein product [Nezara viridula]|uniref:Neuropeptide n=1 Tax=Nezara viridula TaxID=85310 RepID=A0A9P0HFV8_NEZVI|nr:unnamed protein product [Nezara viridula]
MKMVPLPLLAYFLIYAYTASNLLLHSESSDVPVGMKRCTAMTFCYYGTNCCLNGLYCCGKQKQLTKAIWM